MQTSVSFRQPAGVVGEIVVDGPVMARPFTLDSDDAAHNVVARAFTVKAEGVAQAGGTGMFAGILTGPNQYAHWGTAAGTLAPSLTVPNGTVAELTTLAAGIAVPLAAACAIGDRVVFDTATGELASVAADTADAGTDRAFVPNARVIQCPAGNAGLAVIRLGTAL